MLICASPISSPAYSAKQRGWLEAGDAVDRSQETAYLSLPTAGLFGRQWRQFKFFDSYAASGRRHPNFPGAMDVRHVLDQDFMRDVADADRKAGVINLHFQIDKLGLMPVERFQMPDRNVTIIPLVVLRLCPPDVPICPNRYDIPTPVGEHVLAPER